MNPHMNESIPIGQNIITAIRSPLVNSLSLTCLMNQSKNIVTSTPHSKYLDNHITHIIISPPFIPLLGLDILDSILSRVCKWLSTLPNQLGICI